METNINEQMIKEELTGGNTYKEHEQLEVKAQQDLPITNLNSLVAYAQGAKVRLPDFSEGQPLVAMLRRPSMLKLASAGKIPNNLMNYAGEMFEKGSQAIDSADENMLGKMYDLCYIMAEASLVSPTLKEIESAGLALTDEQLMAIFSYSQDGARALANFRPE